MIGRLKSLISLPATEDAGSVLTVFTSADVKQIMSDVASVSTDELTAIDSLSDELVATVETSQDKAAARRELLRHELHSYGALQLEPDMTTPSCIIATALESSSLATFFSNAGSLKHSLKVLIAVAQDPERIFNRVLEGSLSVADEINAAIELGKYLIELKATGSVKSGLRKLLLDMSSKLKKCSKKDVATLLANIKQQLTDISALEHVPEAVSKLVNMCNDDITTAESTIEYNAPDSNSSLRGGSHTNGGSSIANGSSIATGHRGIDRSSSSKSLLMSKQSSAPSVNSVG
eukprot:3016-Heterococcus_DN1.PRE.2